MHCKYCGELIIHRFNGEYTRRDQERKRRHEINCDERPDEITECPGCGAGPAFLRTVRDRSEPFGPVVGVRCAQCDEVTRYE